MQCYIIILNGCTGVHYVCVWVLFEDEFQKVGGETRMIDIHRSWSKKPLFLSLFAKIRKK